MKPNIKPGDVHLIVNDFEHPDKFIGEAKCFNSSGNLLWTLPALCKGRHADYTKYQGDTPPGLYRIGVITETQPWENGATWASFGKWFLDLEGLERNEEKYGRGGCGIHGGGSALPYPMADYQALVVTHGCIRMHNAHLDKVLVPLVIQTKSAGGTVYASVNQFG